MLKLPKKLKADSIAEALLEIRFECEESGSLPEIVVGKLAEFDAWRSFQRIRLPISDIPVSIRLLDPNLKNQPVLELREKDGPRLVKIGVNVFSFHHLVPYPSWDRFRPELYNAVEFLFGSFQEFRATRLGFRYVNAFTEATHGVKDVKQLNYSITVAGDDLVAPQNLNYRLPRSDQHNILVRIASPEFVSGPIKSKCHVLLDLDVYTPDGWETNDLENARDWIEDAHTYEKEEFFNLFTEKMKQRLVEEN